MCCNRNSLIGFVTLCAFAMTLAACAGSTAQEPMEAALPPPQPAAAAPPPPPPPPPPAAAVRREPVYRVRSGSPSVLERFPRGSKVSRDTKICLKAGEQINIVGNNGQKVSYSGPGCMERTQRPTSENQGGFIFGRLELLDRIPTENAR